MTGATKPGGVVAPPPCPADIGIVAALPIEIAPFVARFKNVRKYASERHVVVEGECAGKLVAVITPGPGRKAAERGARVLLAGHRPHWVISAGFGGALNPEFARNDVVLATEVMDLDGLRLSIDVNVPEQAAGRKVRAGRLITVDRIIRTAAEKAEMHGEHHADVVDMETSAVAQVCSARGLRFLSVRVISDEAAADLPPEILSILGRSGSFRIGAAMGAVWRRPGSLKELWALREHAIAAADRLAEFLVGAVRQLP
jgi:adenosylhomocysteine nucleosidase